MGGHGAHAGHQMHAPPKQPQNSGGHEHH
jgi:hypothetical protein